MQGFTQYILTCRTTKVRLHVAAGLVRFATASISVYRLPQSPIHVLKTLRLRGSVPPCYPYLELSAPMLLLLLTAWSVQGRLAADGYELAFRLAHCDQRLLTLRDVVLPYGIVTCEVTRVDTREVRRL